MSGYSKVQTRIENYRLTYDEKNYFLSQKISYLSVPKRTETYHNIRKRTQAYKNVRK